MNPIPRHNNFLLCSHATIVVLNSFSVFLNLMSNNYLVALLNLIVIGCFSFIGLDNFNLFKNYLNEKKQYRKEQFHIETMKVLKAIEQAELEKKKQEIKEKFAHF